jgi:hypothetical protein
MTFPMPLRPGSVRLVACALLVAATSRCTGEYPAPPETRVETVTDVIHGVEIPDDYRWLEDQEAPETRQWIAEQNALAEAIVGESPLRDRIRARLAELMDIPDVGTPRKAGGFEYFTMRRAGEEAAVIYRRPAPEDEEAEEPGLEGEYEVVLDPAAFDPTYRTLVSMADFSLDGRLLMYTLRQGGADEVEYRIRDLETGEDLPDRLPDALYSGVEFDDAGTGFYYTHRSRVDGPRIRHHTLGTDPISPRTRRSGAQASARRRSSGWISWRTVAIGYSPPSTVGPGTTSTSRTRTTPVRSGPWWWASGPTSTLASGTTGSTSSRTWGRPCTGS